MDRAFWKDKVVLVTGHTGFKGTWLSTWLVDAGARVVGYSLPYYHNNLLFTHSGLAASIFDERGDICETGRLLEVFHSYTPEIIIHLAAQPLVRESYKCPLETLQVNIIGTASVLECIRDTESVKCALMVTSDKCYANNEWHWGYRESDPLGGDDPYSCSKGCAELIIASYRSSFFSDGRVRVASVRAGNVIGGGDFSADRIVPDCMRALSRGERIGIRNPHATRPWQHVIEPLSGYCTLVEKMCQEQRYDEAWNFGPTVSSIRTVEELTKQVIKSWGSGEWESTCTKGHNKEATFLSLDISQACMRLGWKPVWSFEEAIHYTVEWYKQYFENPDMAYRLCLQQILLYEQVVEGEKQKQHIVRSEYAVCNDSNS